MGQSRLQVAAGDVPLVPAGGVGTDEQRQGAVGGGAARLRLLEPRLLGVGGQLVVFELHEPDGVGGDAPVPGCRLQLAERRLQLQAQVPQLLFLDRLCRDGGRPHDHQRHERRPQGPHRTAHRSPSRIATPSATSFSRWAVADCMARGMSASSSRG